MATTCSCTLLYHWAGLNVTTLPWMPGNPQMCTFSQTTLTIRTDGRTNGRTDGRTDKNRQKIAVTLRLRFAARVNNIIVYYAMLLLLYRLSITEVSEWFRLRSEPRDDISPVAGSGKFPHRSKGRRLKRFS